MMRGKGEGKYRRAGSPGGRWEGPDGRPPRYAGSPTSSRSVSRSRSPPHRGRPPARSGGGGPARKANPGSRPVRSYSSSGSSRGNSPSHSSSSSEGRRAAPKKAQPPLPGAYKKEMLQHKKKEKELVSRLQAAEEEVQAERSSREALQAKAEFLGEKVKAVAERSKNRGQMLVRLIQGIRQVSEAKAKLAEAETELDSLLDAATSLMQNEEQPARPAAPEPAAAAKAEPAPSAAPSADAAPANHNNHGPNSWTPATGPQSTAPPEAANDVAMADDGGKWTEATHVDSNAPGPKNIRSFKFQLKLPS